MSSRERVLRALNHREPDRVPIFATLTRAAAEKVAAYLGTEVTEEDSWLANRISYTEILLKLGNDVVGIGPTRAIPTFRCQDGVLVDEWGFGYREVGPYREIVKRPLAGVRTKGRVRSYAFPNPADPRRWELAKQQIEKYKNSFAIFGILETTIFEMAWNLVGFEKFLTDLAFEEEYVFLLLDRVMEYHQACGDIMTEMGIDVLVLGDDFGTQEGMLIGPETWRKIFKPRYRELISFFKGKAPGVKIAYHSCGSIYPIIGELVEIGVEVLNPIQPRARGMDLGRLKREYGDRLAFWGGVDIQQVLPFGSPEDVREGTKGLINIFRPGEDLSVFWFITFRLMSF
jgi:uroporphyrinogen decarboxylase